jgi:hypothetical protein
MSTSQLSLNSALTQLHIARVEYFQEHSEPFIFSQQRSEF